MLFTINKNLLIDSFLPQIIILIAMNLKIFSMRFVDDCARNVCEVETWQLSPIKLRLQQHTSSELRIFFQVNKILIGNKPKNHPVFRDGLPVIQVIPVFWELLDRQPIPQFNSFIYFGVYTLYADVGQGDGAQPGHINTNVPLCLGKPTLIVNSQTCPQPQ